MVIGFMKIADIKEITAIVLAAGRGSRIGMPKWKLVHDGKNFLEIIIEKICYAGMGNRVCVVREGAIPENLGIEYAINDSPGEGMFSSLAVGIEKFPLSEAYMIIPVDHPFFYRETLNEIICKYNDGNTEKIIRPCFKGIPGHPIILPGALARTIPLGDYEGGLRRFISNSETGILDVRVDDPGILKNINTKADL